MSVPALSSQHTLLISPWIYTAIVSTLSSSKPQTSTRLAQSREIVSVLHCSLISVLSLLVLYYHSSSIYPTPDLLSQLKGRAELDTEVQPPIISTKSSACNSLTALETGYLIADTVILLRIRRAYKRGSTQGARISTNEHGHLRSTTTQGSSIGPTNHNDEQPTPEISSSSCSSTTSLSVLTPREPLHLSTNLESQNPQPASPSPSSSSSSTSKSNTKHCVVLLLNTRALLTHHTLLLPPLLLLQLYISLHLERGILILTTFLLMNASTPLSTLRWWLRNFSPQIKKLRKGKGEDGRMDGWWWWWSLETGISLLYWSIYGICRLYLIYWVLGIYAMQREGMLMALTSPSTSPSSSSAGSTGAGVSALTSISVQTIWRVFWAREGGLRWWCRIGTGVLFGVNAWWFGWGVRGMLGRARWWIILAQRRGEESDTAHKS